MEKFLQNRISLAIKTISLMISIGFMCSVLYNYGYFYALGLSFHSLPLTLADYTETTLLWSIPVSTVFASYLLIELVLKRLEGGLTEEEIIQSTSNPKKTRKLREAPYKFGKWVLLLVVLSTVISYVIFGSNYQSVSSYFFAAMCAWLLLSNWLNNHPRILQQRSKLTTRVITFLPLAILFMFQYGYDTATHDFTKQVTKYLLYTKNQPANKKQVNLLRTLDRGVLVSSHKNIVFYNWPDIEKIVMKKKKSVGYKGILCDWFKKHCLTDKKYRS